MLWLPENYRQYLIALVVSLLVGSGMMVHIWLNVQIAEQRYLLRNLAGERLLIERENSDIIYAIANTTSLRQIEQSAVAQGYRPTTTRKYIRRDDLATSSIAGLTGAPSQPVSEAMSKAVNPGAVNPGAVTAEPVTVPVRAAQPNGLVEVVGRGLRAAGEWLKQQANATTSAVGDLTAGFTAEFTERWMR